MNRDLLIAIGTQVPIDYTVPLSLGALHVNTVIGQNRSWIDEAVLAHSRGRRPVLVGDISVPEKLLLEIERAKKIRPQIRFALLLHHTQALQTQISDALRSQFDEVFVAVDQMLSALDASYIRTTVRPRWILIPRVGLNWNEILVGRLLPDRRGVATVLCPPNTSEGPFLSPDELLIHINEFLNEHPLIEIRPPPHEWFVPSQIQPWMMADRDLQEVKVKKRSEDFVTPNVSFVIPFHWKKGLSDTRFLIQCLESCLRVVDHAYAQSESTAVEFIICIDCDFESNAFDLEEFSNKLDPRVSRVLTVVECRRSSSTEDWRAGFIRNVGASFSRVGSGGSLVFVDADVEICDPAIVASEIVNSNNSLVFSRVRSEAETEKAKPMENRPFQVASSRLLIVRRSLFENLGGFSNAYNTYGCEDNFLVWQTTEILKKGLPVSYAAFPFATTRHLRNSEDHDDLLEKMIRLGPAADLFYRMTLDPQVHKHFFVSLGDGVGLRFLLKRISIDTRLRWLLGPIVFFLTMLETTDRAAYLRGFWDVVKWKAKRPLLWLSSEAWRVGQAKHVAKKHSWKLPHLFQKAYFLVRHVFASVAILAERALIKMRATRFGWNAFGWRALVGLQKAAGEARRILAVYLLYPALHAIKQLPWLAKVIGVRFIGLIGRAWGFLKFTWGGLKFIAGWTHKFFMDCIWAPGLALVKLPYHLSRLYGWRVLAAILFPFRYVRDNFWKIKILIEKIRGELWRIPVIWNRLMGRLWFIPVAIQRIREKLLQLFQHLKKKRGAP